MAEKKPNDTLSLYRSHCQAARNRADAALAKAVAAVLPKQLAADGDKPPIPPPGGDKTNPDPDADKSADAPKPAPKPAPTGKKRG
ncbi:MAG: hypothetical protein KBI41_08185 [Kiritimatiellae bacterium]|jgi:hypothetical protein|nr:hypothetical protein [Kiritimatiellia bacterium]